MRYLVTSTHVASYVSPISEICNSAFNSRARMYADNGGRRLYRDYKFCNRRFFIYANIVTRKENLIFCCN